MKISKIYLAGFSIIAANAFAQVGINTDTPKTTMDVSAKRNASNIITDNSQLIGLQSPRITRAELSDNTASYGIDQIGALIYITDISGGTATGQRININMVGYYYFDGALWQKFTGSSSSPVNIYNANGTLTSTRTLTQAGFPLTFTNVQSTTFNSGGTGITQDAGSGTRSSINFSNAGNSQLQILTDTNNASQVGALNTSTSLLVGTSFTNSPAPLNFMTSSGSNTSGQIRMTVTPVGRVGIGTSSPGATLQVSGSPSNAAIPDGIISATLSGDQLRAKNSAYTGTQTGTIVYVTAADTAPNGKTINVKTPGYYYFDGSVWQNFTATTNNIYNSNGTLTGNRTVTQAGNTLAFSGTAVNAFSVDGNTLSVDAANGRVGIGTTNPASTLDLRTNVASFIPTRITYPVNTILLPGLLIGGANATPAVGQGAWIGLNPNLSQGAYPIIIGARYSTSSSGEGGADFVVATSAGGNADPKFTVKNGGNVGIGTNNPTQRLHVIGNILASGTITPSDIRIKKDILDNTYGLKEILNLRTINYRYKDENLGKEKKIGFVAQEIKTQMPELVSTANDDLKTLGVNYAEMTVVLTKAVQEQQIQIEELKTRIKKLESR